MAGILGLGLDSGSTTTKGAIFDGERVIETLLLPTSANPRGSIQNLYTSLYQEGMEVVATGYGRDLLPQAGRTITEITCHGRGAAFLCPGAGAVVDIGGQDSKVILLDKAGRVQDFLMNDKCAAGTGRFIEVMLRILEAPLEGLDSFVAGKSPLPINSMCTVFAESEIISLLAQGADRGEIALGVVEAIAKRTAVFAQRLSLTGPVFFSGGLAGYAVFRQALGRHLGLSVEVSPLSQYTGAIGAAILAYERKQKEAGGK